MRKGVVYLFGDRPRATNPRALLMSRTRNEEVLMKSRIEFHKVSPAAVNAMLALQNYVNGCGLEHPSRHQYEGRDGRARRFGRRGADATGSAGVRAADPPGFRRRPHRRRRHQRRRRIGAVARRPARDRCRDRDQRHAAGRRIESAGADGAAAECVEHPGHGAARRQAGDADAEPALSRRRKSIRRTAAPARRAGNRLAAKVDAALPRPLWRTAARLPRLQNC